MEKSTGITTLVMFVFATLLLLSITSCTTDSESDILYERAAETDASTDPNGEEEEKDEDVRRKDVTKTNKKEG